MLINAQHVVQLNSPRNGLPQESSYHLLGGNLKKLVSLLRVPTHFATRLGEFCRHTLQKTNARVYKWLVGWLFGIALSMHAGSAPLLGAHMHTAVGFPHARTWNPSSRSHNSMTGSMSVKFRSNIHVTRRTFRATVKLRSAPLL